MIPADVYKSLKKSGKEITKNINCLYKCVTCGGYGIHPGFSYSKKITYIPNGCPDCYSLGSLYFFELLKYSEFFNEENFYL